MADETKGVDGGALPPKLDLRKQGVLTRPPASVDPKPTADAPETEQESAKQTSRFEVKPAEPSTPEPPVSESSEPAAPVEASTPTGEAASKRETSRIPLEQAKPSVSAEMGDSKPKTIRIKPIGTAAKPVVSPLRITPQGPTASGNAQEAAAKRKTSRIPLEAALTGAAEGESSGDRPKTIKIRRPMEAPTVKLKKPGEAAPRAPRPSELMDTSKLDESALPDQGALTQKKTIKVKRPSGAGKVKIQGGGRPSVRTVPPIVAPPMEADELDEPGWFYGVAGTAALLVLGAVIWMFLAQAIGPNRSLTELSYAKNAVDLPWPGKL